MAKALIVSLNLPRRIGDIITYAKHIATCMNGNAYFPSPPVPYATLLTHIAEFEAAHVVTLSGVHGAAKERDAKLVVVHNDLTYLRAYVRSVASEHGEDADAVVASSGMSKKRGSGPSKVAFEVKAGRVSGSVELVVRSPGAETSYDWQSSVDGEHWVDAGRTNTARQELAGLTPGTRYWFRFRTLRKNVTSDWSDPFTTIVG